MKTNDYSFEEAITYPMNHNHMSANVTERFHSAAAIKSAIESGRRVYSGNGAYEVKKDTLGQFLIVCSLNGYCIGLTGREGTKYADQLNGTPGEFYSVA